MRRLALGAAMLVVHAVAAVAPASAGGTHLSPVRDRYELGEVAMLVGYTSGGQLGWVQDGPFFAYLVAGDTTLWADQRLPIDNVALGPLSVQPRGRALRVSISFSVPDHLAPGLYTVTYCNDPCTTGLGDLIGGSLAVGVVPPRPVQREWPLDEPQIANLADDAVLTGPGGRMTAGEVRAGGVVERPGRGTGAGPALTPDARPAPPAGPQDQGTPAASTVLPEPVARAAQTAVPDERRDDRPLVTILVLMASLAALGAVMGVQRTRARRLESRQAPTGVDHVGGPRSTASFPRPSG